MNKYNLKHNSYSMCIDVINRYRAQVGKHNSWDKITPMKNIIYIKNNNPTKINISDTKGNVLNTNPTYKDYLVLYYMIGDV